MVLGIISTVLGAIIFFLNLIKGTETVQQQTVQYLGFVCASVFIVGGFIMITIKKNTEKPTLKNASDNESYYEYLQHLYETTDNELERMNIAKKLANMRKE